MYESNLIRNKSQHVKGVDRSERDQFLPLSHWFRREILNILKDKDLTFTELYKTISENLSEDIAKSRLHQNLEVLVNGRFLRRYRQGANTFYVLNPDKFKELSDYLKFFIS